MTNRRINRKALWESSTSLRCLRPENPPAEYELHVSTNGIEVSSNGVIVRVGSDVVLGLFPSSSAVLASRSVTIVGSNFDISGSYSVRFGGTDQRAEVVSSTSISCMSPIRADATTVAAVLIRDGQEIDSVSSFTFAFTPRPEFSRIVPNNGFCKQDTPVQLNAVLSLPLNEVRCKFGDHVSNSVGSQGGAVVCVAPPSDPAVLEVWISVSGSEFFSTGRSFECLKPMRVDAISPAVVQRQATTSVTLSGSDFLCLKQIFCQFGSLPVTTAVCVSSTALQCSSAQLQAGNYSVAVTYNQVDFARGSTPLFVTEGVEVLAVLPNKSSIF
eukprot:3639290-Rhodomonas_salina.1